MRRVKRRGRHRHLFGECHDPRVGQPAAKRVGSGAGAGGSHSLAMAHVAQRRALVLPARREVVTLVDVVHVDERVSLSSISMEETPS
jgi:hypothetical protein